MGTSGWSDAAYRSRSASVRSKGYKSGFTYDADLRSSGGPLKVHEKMDPKDVKFRESRDSKEHPESLAIVVAFDVTGSMLEVPEIFQKKLPQLMGMLIRKGIAEHPHVLFAAIGDATCDSVPLQVGQFEAGLEMDEDLSRTVLEGGGGGQIMESYELAMYFFAKHTSIDCFEKRGKKGYCFLLGDEKAYDEVDPRLVERVIGDKLGQPIPTKELVEELKEKYEVFFINPAGSTHRNDPRVMKHWKGLLDDHVLFLEDPAAVCELITSTIGICEGTIDDLDSAVKHLVDTGSDKTTADSAKKALVPFTKSRGVTATGKASGKIIDDDSGDSVKRL